MGLEFEHGCEHILNDVFVQFSDFLDLEKNFIFYQK